MKRKRFGWGWTPVSWTAAIILLTQVGIVLAATTFLPVKPEQPTLNEFTAFLAIIALSIITITTFGLATSPRPKWRWGKSESDNPDEDF